MEKLFGREHATSSIFSSIKQFSPMLAASAPLCCRILSFPSYSSKPVETSVGANNTPPSLMI
jgi:hypothetical protein